MNPPALPLPMDDAPTPSPAQRLHVLKPGMEDAQAPPPPAEASAPGVAGATARTAPLNVDYTATRMLPGALERLQRTHGVVRPDRSELAEAFKRLRSQLLQRLRSDGHSLVAVTSPRAIAGKSLTAVNLALAVAAELDRTVLLVDADLSGQGLQTLFGLAGERGLGEHLCHGTPLDELLLNPGVPRFVLLPGGVSGGMASAELLGTQAMRRLGQELKQRYPDRIVIIDLPPLLDTADALAFLPLADTTLLVVEEHGTTVADMEAANGLLAPFNLVGAVMTRAHPEPKPLRRRWWQRLFRRRADTPPRHARTD